MNLLHSRSLKNRAAGILKQTDYPHLVMRHAVVSFGATLLIVLLQVVLNLITANDAGLSGMGTSAIFQTAKTTLVTAANLLLPFWEIGILYTSIRVTRRQAAEFPHLTQGFRRFGPVLRYYFLLVLIYFGLAMLLSNFIPVLTVLIPIPAELQNTLASIDPAVVSDPVALMELIPQEQLLSYFLPITVLFMLLYGGVLVYITYRFRMSQYLLVDDPAMNALPALLASNQMTKGHKWSLCKLDLSFWWYYLLQLAVAAIAFGPELLELAGIDLGLSDTVALLLFQALSSAAGVVVAWGFGGYVQLTYACAYDELRTPPQDNTVITV